jgi:hypothetical protein
MESQKLVLAQDNRSLKQTYVNFGHKSHSFDPQGFNRQESQKAAFKTVIGTKFSEYTDQTQINYIADQVSGSINLVHLNLEMLAAASLMLYNLRGRPLTPQLFKQNLNRYIKPLMESLPTLKSQNKRNIRRIKFIATLYRYIKYIVNNNVTFFRA